MRKIRAFVGLLAIVLFVGVSYGTTSYVTSGHIPGSIVAFGVDGPN